MSSAPLTPGGPGWAATGASGGFKMDPDWLPYHPLPSKPDYRPPPGAVDAHCHVFGPGAEFPFAPERKYTPCDASKDHLWALRDFLGLERNVIVQATCHGTDNRALVDALRASEGRARGIASLARAVTDTELRALDAAGVRGVRFNFVKRLVDTTPREVLEEMAHRVAPLGWHVVIYFEAAELSQLYDFFASLPTTVVVDHMGRPDVTKSVEGPEFELFVRLMRERPNVWSKVSCPERLSKAGPPRYEDVAPFARRLVATFPDRVLWGTDWPHPNLKGHVPDDGKLLDYVPQIAPTEALRQRLMVENPSRLYFDR